MAQTMRPWMLTALLMATTLAGCFDDVPDVETPEELDSEPEVMTGLHAGNATLYLHSNGVEHWMDTVEDATDTALTGSGTAANPAPRARFALTPNPERDVTFDGPLSIELNVNVDPLVGEAPNYQATLFVDGIPTASASNNNARFELDSPDWPAGSDIALEVCVCPVATTVAYSYRLMTDGSSFVELAFPEVDADVDADSSDSPSGDSTDKQESGVTVAEENGRWVARRTVTYEEVVSVSKADVSLAAPVGDMEVRPGGSGSLLTVKLGAAGETEEEARHNLSLMKVHYSAETSSGVFYLDASATSGRQSWTNQWAAMTLSLKPSELVALSLDTSTGDQNVGAFTGNNWELDTSTGDIFLPDFSVESLTISTSTGDIQANGAGNRFDMETSTGDIDATLEPLASGNWRFDTSTGDIDLRVPQGANYGYDATADTSTGDITFSFGDANDVGEQDDDHRHVRTTNYDSSSIKTVISLDTSTADIQAGYN